MVQGQPAGAGGAVEANEDHKGRRQAAVEAEIVGTAGDKGRSQLEACLRSQRERAAEAMAASLTVADSPSVTSTLAA